MNRFATHVAATSILLALAATVGAQSVVPTQPPRTIYDITALLDQYQPDPSKLAELKAIIAKNPDSGFRVWDNYVARSKAFEAIGNVGDALLAARRAYELAPGQPKDFAVVVELANQEGNAGNMNREIQLRELLAANYEPAQRSIQLSILVSHYLTIGDLESARAAFKRNESAYAGGAYGPLASAWFETARAKLLQYEGKLAAAEVATRKAVRDAERSTEALRTGSFDSRANAVYGARDVMELLVAELVREQGRLGEAELIARGVLQRTLKRVGRTSIRTSGATYVLAKSIFDQGRFAEAAALTRIAVQTNEALGVSPTYRWTYWTRHVQAAALACDGKWQEAVAEHDKIKVGLAADPQVAALMQSANGYIVVALLKTGKIDEARTQSRKLLDQSEQQLGKDHYETAEARGIHAMALAANGQRDLALQQFALAIPILIDTSAAQATEEGLAPSRRKKLEWILGDYVHLLTGPEGAVAAHRLGIDPVDQSFQLADALRGQSVQRALASANSRTATNDPALAALVRQEQDLRHEVTALYRYLGNMLSAPLEQQLPKVTADMRARIEVIARERKGLLATIEQRFPAYAGLINPKTATIEQARAALRPGEALLSMLSTPDRTFVWAIPKQGAAVFASSAMGEMELAPIVARLRGALDPGNAALDQHPGFDVAAAYKLYAELLKPVEAGWSGSKTLLVVSNGPVAQLPLALLPSEPVQVQRDKVVLFDRYREVPWLATRVAVAQLPAVSSLVTLRALPPGNAQRQMFAGFGDPQFARKVAAAAPVNTALKRNLAIPRSVASDTKQLDWMRYEDIPPLPDTRDEILAIAKALGADMQKDVFLGPDASKQKLLSMDLSNRRIIAFATHGLIPGDFPNLNQPALALATPVNVNENGLLTLEEILGLKLDADWVVLSACNTAAGDGQGAEAVSGLGRGFFYAGSRALLVTHWPVESVSARKLVSGIFERYASDVQLTRAEALRLSMLALMQGDESDAATGRKLYSYAHPMFWAPYALIGDGAR